MPIFLNKRHILLFLNTVYKCLFMHIISIKYGPAAAGIVGALNFTQEECKLTEHFEVPVLLKWQGTTEEERLLSSTRQRKETSNILAPRAEMKSQVLSQK